MLFGSCLAKAVFLFLINLKLGLDRFVVYSGSRLYLSGNPPPELYESLVDWLEEDQKRLICVLGDTVPSHSAHPRIYHFGINGLEGEAILRKIAWEGVFLSHNYMQIGETLVEKELLEKLQSLQREIHLLASDFSDFGLQVMRNLLDNLAQMEDIYLLRDWKETCAGIPAIICGAGPSLEESIEQLRLLQGKALVFSGGAGLSALEHFGIIPHFAGGIDPFPACQRLQLKNSLDIPFFFQGRVASDLFKEMRGPKIWVEPSGHFPIESWVADYLGLPSTPFDGGWNVGTFLTAIACYLGCSPIAVIGVGPEEGYAGGIVEGKEPKQDRQAAAKWLDLFVQKHPQIQFSLQGLENHSSISPSEILMRENLSKIGNREKCHSYLIASTFRVKENCEKLIAHWQILLSSSKTQGCLSPGEQFLCQFELEEEVMYQMFCRPVWEIWQHVLKREIEDTQQLELHKWLFIQKMCHSLLFSQE